MGGTQTVNDLGIADFTTIEAQIVNGVAHNGYQIILAGGSANSTTISSGGGQNDNGFASATTVSNGGSQTVAGVADLTSVMSGGTQFVYEGGSTTGTVIYSGGFQYISGGSTAVGTTVGNGGVEVLTYKTTASGTIVDSGGTVMISSGAVATDTVLQPGGMIDVAYFGYFQHASDSATVNGADTLRLTETNGTTVDFSLQMSGSYVGDTFSLSNDGHGGTLITENTPCYCRGTMILTDRGDVAVEDLAIGDRLVTLEGAARPIRWIGRRRFDGWLAAGNPDIQPIRFKAGSLGDHVPARDLLVSPEHAMFLDGALIPARHLVNGVSILPAAEMDEVEYFHLELESHGVIFAEGAASESFLDDGNRGMFHNVYDYHRLYPDAPRHVEPEYCAPRVEDGYELEAVRRRLNGRAARLGPDGTAAPAPVLRGRLDLVTRHVIEGWAFEPADPDARLTLAILANGAEIGRVIAGRHRPDLEAAGIGDGAHAFRFELPRGFTRDRAHEVEVRRAADWTPLPGAPATLEAMAASPLS